MSALLRSSVGGLLASEAETRVAAIVCTTLCHMKRAIVSQGVPKKQPQLYLTHTPCICHCRRAKDSSRISLPRSTPMTLLLKLFRLFCEGTEGAAHLWQYRHRSRLLQVEDGIFCMLNNSNMEQQQIPSKKSGRLFSLLYRVSALEKKPVVYWSIHTKKLPPSFCCRWYSMVLVLTVGSNFSKLSL